MLLLQDVLLCSGFCNGKARTQDVLAHMLDSSFLKLNALGISDLTLDV